ncbi:PQQ-dependent catabolism-associated CXXCW motif protein [Paracoccus sp. WLY502]|uniref:PQQ-dependent catabolism-associated CXXCW motif protein n=1 Tax=Paracoccus yibinensis TaxID=3068891 RepID=UPI0027967BAA|nr:PQQ-dependent catabolism-associated CXXCW motif protein [Paracoccus sp. WLY502]MDQ1901494.1 PQQ-dependent catabolism-associated CXXCW motif protein [Paracoccus sp. WLY502]
MSLPRLIPAALIALMPLAAGAEQAFDATTGPRIADYRAPVPGSVPGCRVPDAETVAAMTGGGALLIDAMAAPGHAITSDGAWIIAAPHQTIPDAHWLPEIGRGRADPRIAAGLRKSLEGCTGRPLVLFRNTGCWIGWNGVQHGAALRQRDIGWYPGGVDDWADAGRALQPVDPLPIGASLCGMDAAPRPALN